ncbi:hypothetical protein RRG08_016175 [Elysia crispata]|uniref:Sulfotransferase domain-containing protein n=1 Tax=Elysia crispata TaxID=231223 RepID=A0AAE1DJM0_9GAST|nr:hypothetical protein RRG08_016175 [Elysia crispata]
MSFCPPRIKVESHRNKIIVTTRNPKDVAVSLYHHHIFLSEMYNYSGDFQDWIPLFLEGKRLSLFLQSAQCHLEVDPQPLTARETV